MDAEGSVHSNGISNGRNDRLCICRYVTEMASELIFRFENTETTRDTLSNFLNLSLSSI